MITETLNSEAENQQPPSPSLLPTPGLAPGAAGQGGAACGASHGRHLPDRDQKVITTNVFRTFVNCFNIRKGFGFINRNDTKEDISVHQPRDGETVECDVVEGKMGVDPANVPGLGGVPVKMPSTWQGTPLSYPQNYQDRESGEKNKGLKSTPEGQAQQCPLYCRLRTVPTLLMWRPYGCRHSAQEQGRPVRQSMNRGYRPRSCTGPPRQRQPREDGNKDDKENQEDEPKVSSHLSQYHRNFNYRHRCPENPNPQDGKETKAVDPPANTSSTPEAEQGRAE
ncbi:unnamed protein product [Nyctereutes procyonoides]|uniref:(raccoon dog) hypothetical protein n=1 Tax=Nyctereutes procyonoides TaxID=34880 RepID=A0A811Y437_NYCPR|nr:unnamed protein product [Nyctereutes procyonoides]